MTPVPVVAYGLGPIGLKLLQQVMDHAPARASVVAAVDIDPDKVGLDIGVLLGGQRVGVKVSADLDIGSSPGDATGVVLHATGSRLADVAPQVLRAVGYGWNVLSTCEELVFPTVVDTEIADKIDREARRHGVSVLGSGINPGFLMDTLPLHLTTVCIDVRSIYVRRIVDTNDRRTSLQLKAGVGMDAQSFDQMAHSGSVGHVGLRQSSYLIAHKLGWEIEDYHEELLPVLATLPTDTPVGRVPAGGVIGQRQAASAWSDGRAVIRLDLQMSAGADGLDEILIDGTPRLHQRIVGGVNGDKGTEATLINLLPTVVTAAPGLITMADLVNVSWHRCWGIPVSADLRGPSIGSTDRRGEDEKGSNNS
jgi:hypothetical protein